jgi:NitT/TauT family transport system substrate-binding protein
MPTSSLLPFNAVRAACVAIAGLLLLSCASTQAPLKNDTPLVPIKVAGARWIELSPVLVAANSFYPQKLEVPSGGVVSITSGAADLATNAETQLLRESVTNPDLRIIMTVSESFYRLVARRSAGISKLSDLKGKRVLVPRLTSAHYYLSAMLRSAGLKDEDVTLVSMPAPPPAPAGQPASPPSRFRSAEALARGDVDVIATFEPEPAMAIKLLGQDAIVLQDRKVYREAFNLNARGKDLADPEKRRAIVRYVRAVADASKALKKDPKPYLPHISSVIGFSIEQIGWGWPETEFPVRIIPDMLDVLETEEVWLARVSNRPPRGRAELARLIDRSVVEEALGLK